MNNCNTELPEFKISPCQVITGGRLITSIKLKTVDHSNSIYDIYDQDGLYIGRGKYDPKTGHIVSANNFTKP